jgi:hypothetical protein
MLAFVHIEKCAGQTVHWILRSSYGINHCDVLPWQGYNAMAPLDGYTARDLQRLRTRLPAPQKHCRAQGPHLHRPEASTARCALFALMREPLRRQASHFQFLQERRQLPITFEEWAHTNDWGPNWQTRMLTGTDDVNEAIRVLDKQAGFGWAGGAL